MNFLQMDEVTAQITVRVHRGTVGGLYSHFDPFKTPLCQGPSLAWNKILLTEILLVFI